MPEQINITVTAINQLGFLVGTQNTGTYRGTTPPSIRDVWQLSGHVICCLVTWLKLTVNLNLNMGPGQLTATGRVHTHSLTHTLTIAHCVSGIWIGFIVAGTRPLSVLVVVGLVAWAVYLKIDLLLFTCRIIYLRSLFWGPCRCPSSIIIANVGMCLAW